MSDESFIGKGITYVNGIDVGNVSNLTFNPDYEIKKLPNYRTSGGGSYNSLPRINSVELNATFHDFSGRNLALALLGSYDSHTGAQQTDEAQHTPATLDEDTLIPTDHLIDTSQTVAVTGSVLDTDFTVTTGGIIALAGGNIAADADIAISYTSLSGITTQALVAAASEMTMTFVGVNEAQNDKPFRATVYRLKFSPTDVLALIGDDFGEIPVKAELLADTSITTAGLSQYFKLDQAA